MKHRAVLVLGFVLLAVAMACGDTQPQPDIEATAQARLVEERAAEATVEAKAQIMAKVMVEATAQAAPTSTPAPRASTPVPPMSTPAATTLSTSEFFERGLAYHNLGQYERATQDYDEAIRLDPQDAIAYNNRGYAYKNLGQYQRAIQDYDEAIRLDPQDAITYNGRGFAYFYLAWYAEPGGATYWSTIARAIQDYDEAIRLDPQYANAYNNRGTANRALGKNTAADRDFLKASELGYTP